MVELLAEMEGDSALVRYLPSLEKEYEFWMNGRANLSPQNPASKHTVFTSWWRNRPTVTGMTSQNPDLNPIGKMFIWQKKRKEKQKRYTEIFALLVSLVGIFSTRWFADAENLSTIRTADIIPVDLNCLLYQLETTLARAYQVAGQIESQANFLESAEKTT